MLNTGRPDYNASIRMSTTLPGEPVFILKGHDPHAAGTVRDYARRAHEGGADPALVESALQHADEMEAFPHKRAPDVSHLAPHEQKQLAYQLQRRAWAATPSRPSQQEILAEQRGANAIASQLRPLLTELFANLSRDEKTGAFTYTPPPGARSNPIIGLSLLGVALNLDLTAPD